MWNLARLTNIRLDRGARQWVTIVTLTAVLACTRSPETVAPQEKARPSILLVTLDTTRADAIGPNTPAFNSVAQRGKAFRWAYATVPQTLPSHASMLTGLYPAGHGIHENARPLAANVPLISERLKDAGYQTAAFVSSFSIARRFGLARGFDVYDDEFATGAVERNAKETTDHALAWLEPTSSQPRFLWVHYFDPHAPYTPPAPHQGYRGEVEFMDSQLARLLAAFDGAIIVVADHGEGLGDHGESQHGYLVYQPTMHVPMAIAGPGVAHATSDTPVSTRRVFHTILDFAGISPEHSLRADAPEVVMGEAMVPFLQFGWQPQVMAIDGTRKGILAGRLETYDVAADPAESRNLGESAEISRPMRQGLRDYPIPSLATSAAAAQNLDDEARKQLASLGYITSAVKPVVRKDAPRAADMTRLFPVIEQATGLFVTQQYAKCIPLLERILKDDPYNLEAALRLAVSHSSLGHGEQALAAFRRAEAIAPDSADVRTYLALHHARGSDWKKAVPLLERITSEDPNRLPPLEALAVIRERQGRIPDAIQLREKVYALRSPTAPELRQLGAMQMSTGQTDGALRTFERLRTLDGAKFDNHLELGVLYLAAGRPADARTELDQVQPGHRDYAMALFKRAQVAVLLKEQDAPSRIEMARRFATPLTRELIARERLFQ